MKCHIDGNAASRSLTFRRRQKAACEMDMHHRGGAQPRVLVAYSTSSGHSIWQVSVYAAFIHWHDRDIR